MAAEHIEVTVDEAMLKAIEAKLKDLKAKAPRALKNAINATARNAKTDLASKAQQTYTVKTSKFKSNIKQRSATTARLEATLTIAGQPNSASSFEYRVNSKRYAARMRVLKAKSLQQVYSQRGQAGGGGAFAVTFSSGHKDVAQRRGTARLPIKTLYGPSDPIMVGSDSVFGKIKPDIYKLLYSNINKQIEKLLK